MDSAQTLLTAEDLLALDDGLRHELVNGELITMTPSGGEHGVITARLARLVDSFASERGLGLVFGAEAGFRLTTDPDTVRAPDLAFVRHARIPDGGIPTGFWPGAPDLAAEVVSPGDTYEHVAAKVADWLRAGSEVVWVINPRARSVTVHTGSAGVTILSETEQLTGGTTIPGFTCGVREIFP
jgi:Uma2 family endonuclease